MIRSKFGLAVISLAMALIFPAKSWGQADTARLSGTVQDSSGGVIPEANITIINEKTNEKRVLRSDAIGNFRVLDLLPTIYTIHIDREGFASAQYKKITLALGQEVKITVILQPSSVNTTIFISSGTTVVDTSSASMSSNVGAEYISTLPANGRQMSQFALLAPGAITSGGGSYDNIRFNGRANQQNAIRFDGVEGSSIIDSSPGNLNGETSTSFRLHSNIEGIQEFRVDSSSYPAEFGTGTGGQISIISKSGGNTFTGAVFEYLRNDKLDARNFFDGDKKSALRLNQFGFSSGGPIIKDKFFFFGSYEGLRQGSGVNFIETVPSATARATAVPTIRPLLAGYPLGSPTANPELDVAQLNTKTALTENYAHLRLDYKFNSNYSLYFRYFRDQGYSETPQGVTGNYFLVTAVPQNAVLNFQQILSSSMINETKVGLNASKTRASGFAPAIPGVDTSAFRIDFTGNTAIAGIGGQGASASAASLGNLIRSNSTQNGRGQPYTNYSLSFIDNLSKISGSHTFKFGAEVRPLRITTDRLGGTTYAFSNVSDFMANRPSNIQFLGDLSDPSPFNNGAIGRRQLKQTYYIGYAQDEWKIKPNFTMNYGLRYEYYSVIKEDRNLITFFDTENGGLLPNTTAFYQSSKLNFGPRLALTWAPKIFKNKTLLRLGSGYYYGPGQTEDQIQPIETDRQSRALTNALFPIDLAQVKASYNINDPNLGYQPRAYAPGYTLPEQILSYTLSVQQQLPGNISLTVAYVGSQGRNLFLRSWTNRVIGVNMNPTTGAGIPVLQFGNRFSQIDFKTSGGTDHYDSMQTSLFRRFSNGFTFGSQWTWSHSLGNTGGSNEAQTATNPLNFELDRGNNAFDVRHSFNFSGLYAMPFGKSKNRLLNSLLANWEIGSTVNGRTGLPIDVKITRPDLVYQVLSTGEYVSNPLVSGGVVLTRPVINVPSGGAFRNQRRPDFVPGMSPFLETRDRRYILNPAAFAIPRPGTYGNLGRYALHGPALFQMDLTIRRTFKIVKKVKMDLGAEVFNIFNRANFTNPPTTLANALGTGTNRLQPGQPFTLAAAGGNFGIANSTVEKTIGLGTSRQIQLSLRLSF
ncbi:MAG: carboxypeptidase regulatory-like domain-containing protein [bacterium]|nr:carboxypeptidase regulatory-like domain-containing protein [bacterium]